MRLSGIVAGMHGARQSGEGDPDILSLSSDSRDIVPGALFAALPGVRDDGARHIRDAVDRGAAAVVSASSSGADLPVPLVSVPDARKALGEAADVFYGHPSRSLDLIGVTGTNGKTTTAYLVRHVMNHAGRRCGMLGTIEYDLGGTPEAAPLTTPDAVRFTRSLAAMRDSGCRAAVAEASSHALSQDRVYPHRFACAIFTNLTRDHLDYHGSMESYLAAKRILFESLDGSATGILNFRDPAARRMADGCRGGVDGYFLAGAGDPAPPPGCRAAELAESGLDGQRFRIAGVAGDFFTPLVGRHNAENCIGAILTALALGVKASDVRAALAEFHGVPGRLERLAAPSGAKIFIDYAHTDDAIRSVLSVLRPLVGGKLITVFGCGGDRDGGKRPLMAKAAEEASDRVVVTSDNPRTEDPTRIIADIMAGFARPDAVLVRPDRAAAVKLAVEMAGRDDAVLLAGKGHENYQIIGTEKIHLDDRELARAAFRA